MASMNVQIHPDGNQIRSKSFPDEGAGAFDVLIVGIDQNNAVDIFVSYRSVLDALQVALDAIRADFDVRELVPAEAAS